MIKAAWRSFLNETSIHGFRYVANATSTIEGVFWVVAIIIGITLNVLIIWRSLRDSQKNPILTTVELIELNTVPFPAISVDTRTTVDFQGYGQSLIHVIQYTDNEKVMSEMYAALSPAFQNLSKFLQQTYEQKYRRSDLATMMMTLLVISNPQLYYDIEYVTSALAALDEKHPNLTAELLQSSKDSEEEILEYCKAAQKPFDTYELSIFHHEVEKALKDLNLTVTSKYRECLASKDCNQVPFWRALTVPYILYYYCAYSSDVTTFLSYFANEGKFKDDNPQEMATLHQFKEFAKEFVDPLTARHVSRLSRNALNISAGQLAALLTTPVRIDLYAFVLATSLKFICGRSVDKLLLNKIIFSF